MKKIDLELLEWFQKEIPITANELSQQLGISRVTLWNWCKYGRIKGHKLENRGTMFFFASEINPMLFKAIENGYINKKILNDL